MYPISFKFPQNRPFQLPRLVSIPQDHNFDLKERDILKAVIGPETDMKNISMDLWIFEKLRKPNWSWVGMDMVWICIVGVFDLTKCLLSQTQV
jgi:hypothetical protein